MCYTTLSVRYSYYLKVAGSLYLQHIVNTGSMFSIYNNNILC